MAGIVELKVRDRPGRTANRIAIHAANKAKKCLCWRENAENIVPLVVQGRPGNLDQANVIRAAVAAELLQPRSIEDGRRRYAITAVFVKATHSWVFVQFHDHLDIVYLQVSSKKTSLLAIGAWRTQFPHEPVQHGNPVGAEEFRRLALGVFPGRQRLVNQPHSLRGQAKWLSAAVLFWNNFNPPARSHPFDIAT
jgi:hypothetical protein